MLTKRQNFVETIRGGKPDRFVNQFEALSLLYFVDPINKAFPIPAPGSPPFKGIWGVTQRYDKGQPGPMPIHDDIHTVLKDIKKWKETITMPQISYPDSAWEESIKIVEAINRNETFVTVTFNNGIFERLHYLMGIEACMINFYEEPAYMHELIEYIVEFELRFAEQTIKHWKPDALFHHDDWGTQTSLFLSPDMFQEFIKPAYMQIYKYYRSNGVGLIIHHSDSYAANLVPDMMDMGIDVYQGCMSTNNVPELIKKYGGKISFMGDLDNGVLDKANWTPELVHKEVNRACTNNGKLYYIPCLVRGRPESTYPGVYDAVSADINRMSKEMF